LDAASFPAPMPRLPQPGELVRWRCRRHALERGWVCSYGPGPFVVARVVGTSRPDGPAGVIVRTLLGERKIEEVWLATQRAGQPQGEGTNWEGYSPEVLEALD